MLSLSVHALIFAASFLAGPAFASHTNTHHGKRTELTAKIGRYAIPIQRSLSRHRRIQRRGSLSGQSGLGDNSDLLYSVPVELGTTVTAVNLDTGSSDLWAVSEKCQAGTCKNSAVTRYPSTSGNQTGIDVTMLYGDSTTGTFATGTVGIDIATVAGVAMTDQAFGVIDETNNTVVRYNTAGIFGLGFPAGSKIQESVVTTQIGPIDNTDDFILATYTSGPLLARMFMTGELQSPMFAITLNRDTIDISGQGQLTLGKLPDGIDNSSLTWVPVRLYDSTDGGIRPPTFAPSEVYPFRWEVDIDAVYIDGQLLPNSTIPALNGVDSARTSALLDTGNSIIRGPQDVVDKILQSVSPSFQPSNSNSQPTFPCNTPHTLEFVIGGKSFPVDPRDFAAPLKDNDASTCQADNLVATDPPRFGALFRWSLGDTFLKSNLVAFHYGNLTHPSVDPPRIGFLSLVPSNANDLYAQAVQNATNNDGNFEQTIDVAPTASAADATQVTVSIGGVPDPTHLNAISTLSLSATTIAAPTSNSRKVSSTTPSTFTSYRGVMLSICIVCLSWTFLYG